MGAPTITRGAKVLNGGDCHRDTLPGPSVPATGDRAGQIADRERFHVPGSRVRVLAEGSCSGFQFEVPGSGFRVRGSGFGVPGSGFEEARRFEAPYLKSRARRAETRHGEQNHVES
jgi:hypothetical protein